MKICDFSFLLFLRKNEKTPETLLIVFKGTKVDRM